MSVQIRNKLNPLNSPKVAISGLLLAYLIYAYISADSIGYCREQERMIPDQEICENLFEGAIKAGNLKLGVQEKNGLDYLENHQNHCRINRNFSGSFRLGGLFSVFFDDSIEVFLTYEMTDLAKKRNGVGSSITWDEWIFLSPCGKIRKISGISGS
ncbi:hypothetical protein ACO0LO_18920 [Undibacterium sp. TJN25]|uniref:hypothetical protein n=1 Tax=Undibacterium sp. TJN25 TaxID=3413056 RepID=UPI003BF0BE41